MLNPLIFIHQKTFKMILCIEKIQDFRIYNFLLIKCAILEKEFLSFAFVLKLFDTDYKRIIN
jgi:hypothetical protein